LENQKSNFQKIFHTEIFFENKILKTDSEIFKKTGCRPENSHLQQEIRRLQMAKKKSKYSFINEVHEQIMKATVVNRRGEAKVKRSDLKNIIETAFNTGAKAAASGERVRFPVIGALVRKEVKARKSGKGVNPFTGEPMEIKARPATKKPRWSFPRSLKDTFANKRNW
jgi:nucleoid DNA-binding protein